MSEGIKSIDELRKAQAAAQAQGSPVTDYEQWAEILDNFEVAGIKSTGNYAEDVKLHSEVMKKIRAFIEESQQLQRQQQANPKNDEVTKVDGKTSGDKEHVIKANLANATSSVILADYMKYYHML